MDMMKSEIPGLGTQATITEKLRLLSPHPLDQLSGEEIRTAADIIRRSRPEKTAIVFRTITLEEPAKATLVPFLEIEHQGKLSPWTPRPPRLARILHEVIHSDKSTDLYDSVVDVGQKVEVSSDIVDKKFHAPMSWDEVELFTKVVHQSPLFKAALEELSLPDNVVVVIDPWMYGGWDGAEGISPRCMQGLVYARDPMTNHPDSNHYAFPLPLIPVMDMALGEIIRIDRLATGGTEDGHNVGTGPSNALDHCKASEYIPELQEGGMRQDLKPLNIVQPYGPSFTVTGNSLVEWQKWRFRVGFNPREGATIHDVCYDGRSVFYRLSFSEMSVPYGDPRAPYHRKQAFDFGDGGAGRAANNLELGCDCLGLIKYFDAVMNDTSGNDVPSKNVVCMHEQDDGILWKHTNYRTGRAVVTRNRRLVVQFIITLANYEYIFAYQFDMAGGITIETRATGIASIVPIDPGKTSPWGNIVSPGALAQNHQHLFCFRIDPAIDGHQNSVIQEESHPLPFSPDINPYGHGYEVRRTTIKTSCGLMAAPEKGRLFKIANPNVLNPISSRPIGYKLVPSPTQLALAHPESLMGRRMAYATSHVWVTKHVDGEFWAAGKYTNQSSIESGGVRDMAERHDGVENEDIVVWHSFGLTHNPRTEDFPVMPVECHQFHLKPADFFTRNPAIDVPSNRNLTSQLHAVNGITNGHMSADISQGALPLETPRTRESVAADELANGMIGCCAGKA